MLPALDVRRTCWVPMIMTVAAIGFAPSAALRSQSSPARKCTNEATAQRTLNNARASKAKTNADALQRIDIVNCKRDATCINAARERAKEAYRAIKVEQLKDAAAVSNAQTDCESDLRVHAILDPSDTTRKIFQLGVDQRDTTRSSTTISGVTDRDNRYTTLPAMTGRVSYGGVEFSVNTANGHIIGQVIQGDVVPYRGLKRYSWAEGTYKNPSTFQITRLWDLDGRPVTVSSPIDVPMSRRR